MKCDIVGVHGSMGSGKDSLYFDFFRPLGYTRYAFATPLYEIAALQFNIKSGMSVEYNKHVLHNKFVEIAGGKAAVDYDKAYKFVEEDLPRIAEETNLYADASLGRKSREFLQHLGTDYFRANYGVDVWCNYLTNKIITDLRKDIEEFNDALDNEESNLILVGSGSSSKAVPMSRDFYKKIYISDIRFENEAMTVSQLSGKISYAVSDISVKSKLIKLEVSQETILQRVNQRDMFSEKKIKETLEHSSENTLPNNMFDIIADANQSQVELYQELETKLERFI